MITRPVAAAANATADGAGPAGTAKPSVNIADPAEVKADVMPAVSNGHSRSV
jgi:hypothetical protein